ncbi:hypothetical protein KORDIASMS9_03635 [Kordia sp. SMS9]|uniref:hypothetical protein n=1 Tax=Kordia sp. SMS9 TaxID=2282170 RepID=UPI000E0D6B26|nr:hypothetical protein [Kordia sp. SMS9]AXG71378.1 hypothetical protein KORDIASMS9_03635 [Kordia sp. SMS9]
MKNLVRTIVPLVLGAVIGFFICKEYFCEKSPVVEKEPKGIITVNEAINLHEAYVQKLNDTMYQDTNNPDFKETQFVWFSMEKIRDYVNYLDHVEKVNPKNPKISGIRVYFGKYNEHKEYEGQQTVFFTPTVDTKLAKETDYPNMKNLPFYILPKEASSPLVGKYKVIKQLLLDDHRPSTRANDANVYLGHKESKEKMAQKSTNAKNGDDGTSLSFNEGQLSPPPPRN